MRASYRALVGIVPQKSYRILALVILSVFMVPGLSMAASDSDGTTVNVVVDSVISISTLGSVDIGVTPAYGQAKQSSAKDTVEVSTNNSNGYTLSLKDADATLSLERAGGGAIAASSDTPSAPDILADNTWGWRVDSDLIGDFGAGPSSEYDNQDSPPDKYAGISSSDYTIRTTSSPVAGDATDIFYAVRVDTSVVSGLYTDTVTYTATTNL